MRSTAISRALQGHCAFAKAPLPGREDRVPEKRARKGLLGAVTDQRFVVAPPACPGRMAEVHRYDRILSPPCNTVLHQSRKADDRSNPS